MTLIINIPLIKIDNITPVNLISCNEDKLDVKMAEPRKRWPERLSLAVVGMRASRRVVMDRPLLELFQLTTSSDNYYRLYQYKLAKNAVVIVANIVLRVNTCKRIHLFQIMRYVACV